MLCLNGSAMTRGGRIVRSKQDPSLWDQPTVRAQKKRSFSFLLVLTLKNNVASDESTGAGAIFGGGK